MIQAVLFDWGGTLTTFHNVDMIDAWRVAAEVLAPDRVDDVAEALLAAEREVWSRTTSTMRSATTAEVLRTASDAVGMPVEVQFETYDDMILPQFRPATSAKSS